MFSLTLITFSVTFGLAINAFMGTIVTPSIDALVGEGVGPIKMASLWALVVLFLASLLRRGVRKFQGELRLGLSTDAHEHLTVRA